MTKLMLFSLAVALAGCATRQERVAAIQAELPQLITACDGAFRDGSSLGLGIVPVAEGVEACGRLAFAGSLDQVQPATAELYKRYKGRGAVATFPVPFGPDGTGPGADVGVQAWAPGMPLPVN